MTASEPLYVQVLADYGRVDDMAFAEVRQSIREQMADQPVIFESSAVPVFDTYATGFFLAQLAINSKLGEKLFYYVNTAPRKDDLGPRVDCAGEGLVYFKLKNGARGVVVNSGCSLSFVKNHAEEIRLVDCEDKGSQFRSRDVFPHAMARVITEGEAALKEDVIDTIPDRLDNIVAYTDGYGNIKTTISSEALKGHMGKRVNISINGIAHRARIGEGIFNVADGEMVMAPGSSGWPTPNGDKRRWVEIVLRGGSAARLFKRPIGGSKLEWSLSE